MSHPSQHTLDPRVRRATEEDIPQLCRIERSATARFRAIPELAFLVDGDVLAVEKVREWLDAGRIYVFGDAEQSSIGFIAAFQKDSALYIAEVSVLADENGKGAGSILIETVKDWARQRVQEGVDGAGKVARVSLTTYPDVPWNGPFYRKRGFKEVPAETIGPRHVLKMTTDKEERNLVQPGYRRCCMLWEDQ